MKTKVITQDRPIPTDSPGFADIVGFGVDGVVILRNGINIQPFTAIKDFGYNAGGWRVDKHVRLVADLTGDGTGDLVGFGELGVVVSLNNGDNTFTSPPRLVLQDFGYLSGGWRVDRHIRYLSDIRGVGRCDIVGFGDGGVSVSRNEGGGIFKPTYTALHSFGYNAGGWRLNRHLRFLGDATGDGLPDIIGFGEGHVYIGRNNGDGTFAPAQAVINDFCPSKGWVVGQNPRFIADLTGDGRVDIIGFGSTGVYASLNKGDGTFGPIHLIVGNFGINEGWTVNRHPRYIADLTGDKRGDIIGFGDTGVWVVYNNGNGTFQTPRLVLEDFCLSQGWRVDRHPRFVADLTGDGRVDIIGFGESHVCVSFNDGKGGFGPVIRLTAEFAHDEQRWSPEMTVRWIANLGQSR